MNFTHGMHKPSRIQFTHVGTFVLVLKRCKQKQIHSSMTTVLVTREQSMKMNKWLSSILSLLWSNSNPWYELDFIVVCYGQHMLNHSTVIVLLWCIRAVVLKIRSMISCYSGGNNRFIVYCVCVILSNALYLLIVCFRNRLIIVQWKIFRLHISWGQSAGYDTPGAKRVKDLA